MGRQVLLVDADMHRRKIHNLSNLNNNLGTAINGDNTKKYYSYYYCFISLSPHLPISPSPHLLIPPSPYPPISPSPLSNLHSANSTISRTLPLTPPIPWVKSQSC